MAHPIYGKFPFAVVNRWLAADLQENGILDAKVNIKGVNYSTIIPSSQLPAINDSKIVNPLRQTTFIVYNVEDDDAIEDHYKKNEGITYAVFSPDPQKVLETIYCAQDLFARKDWSVQDLNDFENSPFEFIDMKFEEVTGLEPIHQEDGRYGSMIYIKYSYASKNIIGTPGAKGQGRRA